MSSKGTTKTLALAAVVMGALLGGCMAGDLEGSNVDPINECQTDADCLAHGGRCDTALGACVTADPPLTETLFFYVTDPQVGVAAGQQVELADVDLDGGLSLPMGEPIAVRGLVIDEASGETPLAARLTFRRSSHFAGASREPVYVEASDQLLSDETTEPYNYQVRLMPGVYEVEIEPSIDALEEAPSHQRFYPLRRELDLSDSRGQFIRDFAFPADRRTISSLILDVGGVSLSGVRVYAFDTDDGRRISNVATTSCGVDQSPDECGRFTLSVPPEVNAFGLRFSGSAERPLLPIIEAGDYTFAAFDTEEPIDAITSDELGVLSFPELETPVLWQTVIEGNGRDGVPSPLSGTTLELRSVVTSEHTPSDGRYELSATTNSDGEVVAVNEELRGPDDDGIYLRPGCYDVTIIAPTEGEFSNGSERFCLEDDGVGGEQISMGPRALLSGQVFSPDGRPVPQARLEATSEDGFSFVTTSDDLGFFSMFVDRGRYELLCVPPDQSVLSWTRFDDVDAFHDFTYDVEVGWGTPVSGAVTREGTDEPIESALVEGYIVREILDGPSPQLVPIARLRTTSDGRFTLLVPEESDPP